MILTQYSGAILGPFAVILGHIMNWIYVFLDNVFNIQNIGLCIILFTIIIYLFLLPLTIRQQKFSRLQQKMQPELNEIKKKYKNKKDQASMLAMNEETKVIYQKYGVSPAGSCIQILIQMPILLALYRVISNIPAYVGSVKSEFTNVIDGIVGTSGYQDAMNKFIEKVNLKTVRLNFEGTDEQAKNSIIDVLYALPSTAWNDLKDLFPSLTNVVNDLEVALSHLNNLFGVNIANAPSALVQTGWSTKDYLLIFGALMIPILSGATQMLNLRLAPTVANNSEMGDTMASSMKTMNVLMPLMSLVFAFNLPVGMGIYWIAGAVIRSIQQIVINRHIDKINLDDIIKKNQEKAKQKRKKKGISENYISSAAHINTRKLSDKAKISENASSKSQEVVNYSKNAKPGSLSAKANMVREYNERKNK
jgi:YidC/Oxa1 family membrane protein insertase